MALGVNEDVRVQLLIGKSGVHLKPADRGGRSGDGGGAPPVLVCAGQQAPNGRTHCPHIADMLSNHSIRRQRRHAIELHPVGAPRRGQFQELDRGAADIHPQQVSRLSLEQHRPISPPPPTALLSPHYVDGVDPFLWDMADIGRRFPLLESADTGC